MKVSTLQEAMMEELQDLLDAEKQLVRALPKMARAAGDDELRNAFNAHLEMTRNQVARLERVFGVMGARPRSKPCPGMRGIIEEGQEIISGKSEQAFLDTAIAGAARKVEHYEIAGYESARSLARQLGGSEAARLLEQTLREEVDTDKKLARISTRLMKEAGRAGAREEKAAMRPARRRQPAARKQRASRQAASRGRRAAAASARGQGSARPLTDHDEIRRWAEEHGAQPAGVKGTGGRGDVGMIRLDFPGFSGEESLEPISWDEWFQKFDENELALLVGQGPSTFNKLVSRASVAAKQRPRARKASG